MTNKQNTNETRQETLLRPTMLPWLLLSATLALGAGCSSSDDDDDVPPNDPGSSFFVGFVSVEVEEVSDASVTELAAGFFQFEDTTLTDSYFDALSTQLNGGDVCFVSEEDSDDSVLDLEFDFETGEMVSAGETLTLTSPAGTYATLERQTLNNPTLGTLVVYTLTQPGDVLAGLPPAGLTLDIPGDVFPAFSNVSVPNLPTALTDFSPSIGGQVGGNTAFSWTSSGVVGAGVLLELVSDAESINCLLVDDGNFTLPASVTDQLTGTFVGTVDDVDREAIALEGSEDAVLFILVEDGRGDLTDDIEASGRFGAL